MKYKTYDRTIKFLEKILNYFKEKRRKNLFKMLNGIREYGKIYFEEATGGKNVKDKR